MSNKVKVVGGAYWELSALPPVNQCYGSGGRAAAVLSSLQVDCDFHCYFPEIAPPIYGITPNTSVNPQHFPYSYEFQYLHPLASPNYFKRNHSEESSYKSISIYGDKVLAYGMMEGPSKVEADTLVIDPQSSSNINSLSDVIEYTAKRVALVLNLSEARAITDQQSSESTESLLREVSSTTSIQTIVLKLGALGSLVLDQNSITKVPSYYARRHYKIGSGDVFSSTFFKFWGIDGLQADEAAHYASKATSFFLENNAFADKQSLESITETKLFDYQMPYVAGSFFNIASRWQLEETLRVLSLIGHNPLSPMHINGMANPARLKDISKADLELIDASTCVFANLSDFDTGSLIEVGYAIGRGKHVVAYIGEQFYGQEFDYRHTMLNHDLVDIHTDYASALAAVGWM